MRPGPLWSRLAAASGIVFVALVATAAIIVEVKDAGQGAVAFASNEVFGTVTLFVGFGAVAFHWFAGTLAARLRQLEGGSGRLTAVVNGSGAILAAILALNVGTLFAARTTQSADLARLADALLFGPTWYFPSAAFIGATAVVGIRAPGLPMYSAVIARLGFFAAAAYAGAAGLMLFKGYAWINDTAYIVFLAFVLALSIIGVIRWSEMDSVRAAPGPAAGTPTPRGKAAPRRRKAAS